MSISDNSTLNEILSEINLQLADSLSEIDTLIGSNSNTQLVGDGASRSIVSINTDVGYDKTITTGNGNDVIQAGLGNDTLTGGLGADTFIFGAPSEGVDKITDFAASQGDKIEVSASGFGIGSNEFSRFSFDNATGALFFDNVQLASLQPNSGFIPSTDIIIA